MSRSFDARYRQMWARSRHLARRSGFGVAGVGRSGRLDQQQVRLVSCDGTVLDTFGYDEHLPRSKRHRSISQLDIEHALEDEKEVIGVVVLVPDKFSFHLHDHDVAIVEPGDGAW